MVRSSMNRIFSDLIIDQTLDLLSKPVMPFVCLFTKSVNKYAIMYMIPFLSLLIVVCSVIICLWRLEMRHIPWQPLVGHYFVTLSFNTLRPRQNGRHFPDDILKCIFLNEKVWISIKISLEFVPKGSISNSPALVQIMAWRRLGDKPLSEPILACSPTHICVSRPQWVKSSLCNSFENWAPIEEIYMHLIFKYVAVIWI